MMQNPKESTNIFDNAINNYISFLNSQKVAYPLIIPVLKANEILIAGKLKECLEKCNIENILDKNYESLNEEELKVIYQYARKINRDFEKLESSSKSISLISNNFVVSLVSIYDAYLGILIKCIYETKPEILNSCSKEFKISDIIKYGSIESLKKHVIDKEVENVLRESHAVQFEWLEKLLSTKLKNDLPHFKDFIEITERRNLFVHCNGKVSQQYLDVCKKYDKETNSKLGDTLNVDGEYLNHAYNILFEIGVKLGQVIWRNINSNKSLEEADDNLLDLTFNLIKEKKYDLASVMLNFATEKYVKHFDKATEYVFLINKALNLYLQDKKNECNEIIDHIDLSASEFRFKLAAAVLKEDYVKACEYMNNVDKQEMQHNYIEWPLYSNFIKSKEFKDQYKKIYGQDFVTEELSDIGLKEITSYVSTILKDKSKSKKKSASKKPKAKSVPKNIKETDK